MYENQIQLVNTVVSSWPLMTFLIILVVMVVVYSIVRRVESSERLKLKITHEHELEKERAKLFLEQVKQRPDQIEQQEQIDDNGRTIR